MIEYLTIGLLVIIAFAEVWRLVLTQKKTTKKQHFQQKLDGTTKMIWDLQFKVFKTKEIREDIRKEYDNIRARMAATEEQKKTAPKEDVPRMDDALVLMKRDSDRLEAQMKDLDVEINGSKKTNEYPDGVEGINQQIDSYMELVQMLKDWKRDL